MRSFVEFLLETSIKPEINEYGHHIYTEYIGPHKLETTFCNLHNRHYEVGYKVNGSDQKIGQFSEQEKNAISIAGMRHVRHFLKHNEGNYDKLSAIALNHEDFHKYSHFFSTLHGMRPGSKFRAVAQDLQTFYYTPEKVKRTAQANLEKLKQVGRKFNTK